MPVLGTARAWKIVDTRAMEGMRRRPALFSTGAEPGIAAAALGFVLAAGLLRLAFGETPSVVAILALVAPGFALIPLLPPELRPAPISWLLGPPLGFAGSSILLITASTLGLVLSPGAIYVLLAVLCALALVAARAIGSPAPARLRGAPEVALLLAGVLLLAVGLEARAIGGSPLPGTDWGHYLLYSTEIAQHRELLLDNPLWMFGDTPFAEDPGVPSLYGAYLILSGHGPGPLYHGIWVFALLGIVTTFVFVRTLFGDVAGLVAAAIAAIASLSLNMLTWHGLANTYAIMYIPLILLAVGMVLRGSDSWRWSGFLALFLVALAAGHRLSFLIVAVALVGLLGLCLARDARLTARFAARTVLGAAVLGWGVTLYLLRQADAMGGVQGYQAYLPTKITGVIVDLVVNNLTWPVIAALALALIAILSRRRLRADPASYVPVAFLAALLLVGFSWVVHFPTDYNRIVYFLPLPIAALVGIGWTGIPRRLAPVAAVVTILTVAWVSTLTYDRVAGARNYYSFLDSASERGLELLAGRLGPHDVVAADRCWSFIAPWLLRHRVLAGLDPSNSLAAADAGPSAIARQILSGGRRATLLARRYGVRYALIDPLCDDENGHRPAVPAHGAPVYESTQLVILRF
jgi:hypothetical protein